MADINIIELDLENSLYFIFVKGQIELQDGLLFLQKTVNLTKAVVFLDSPGGNVEAGVSIGGQIRAKGFATAVTPGTWCASAAALAWLGGARRYMEPSSRIGFHASARASSGRSKIVSSTGNAVIGGYLADLGLSRRAIRFITSCPPDDIAWLTFEDARDHGIEVLEVKNITPSSDEEFLAAGIKIGIASAQRFKALYRSSGMAGLRAEINDGYETAARTHSLSDALEVYLLDRMASEFDAAIMMATFNMEQVDEKTR